MKKVVIVVVILAVIIGLGIFLAKQSDKVGPVVVTNNLGAVPSDSALLANMHKAGLDALSAEGTVLHIHQHLDIQINGADVPVPEHVGIGSNFISPIHTHDTTGILHVESPVAKDFTLGQFFDEWGVTLSDSCVGTYCTDSAHKLLVAVNGQKVDSNYHDIVLKAHQEIQIWYGLSTENPVFTQSYDFPQGY